ncbi:MAG: universal stress protein [Acidobacteriota bacterium]
MIDLIIFATDFSATSRKTLEYAGALAQKTGARIIGAHALKPPSSIFSKPDEELKEWEDQHLQRLNAFLEAPEVQDVPCEARLASGAPQQALGKLARDEKADLILVAKRSRSTLEKFFVGSSTERIVVDAPCPVLVAPELEACTTKWNPVLCPIDFSGSSNFALEWAIRLCKEYDASLSVLHVTALPEAGQGRAAALAKAEQKVAESLSLFDAPPDTRSLILEGKPSQQILDHAEQMNCDLVVMGLRGMNQGDYVGMGSTALAVLKGETFPLLIVPGRRSL